MASSITVQKGSFPLIADLVIFTEEILKIKKLNTSCCAVNSSQSIYIKPKSK